MALLQNFPRVLQLAALWLLLPLACGNDSTGDSTASGGSPSGGTSAVGGTGTSLGGSSSLGGSTSTTSTTGGLAGQSCGTTSAEALRDCVSEERFTADLNQIATAREPGSTQWQFVQDLCASRFESLGFTVVRQNYATGTNVIGTLGTNREPTIVISAHYDSIANCPGADDNATGVAGVLETARVLAQAPLAGRLIVACWDEEELGLIGSQAYVQSLVAASETVSGSFVYEMIGYFSEAANSQTLPTGFDTYFPTQAAALAANGNRGNFIVVAADETSTAMAGRFVSHATAVDLLSVEIDIPAALLGSPVASALGRSDHASFWLAGYPAISLTDTANYRNTHYHCEGGTDAVSDLSIPSAVKVLKATVGATANEFGL